MNDHIYEKELPYVFSEGLRPSLEPPRVFYDSYGEANYLSNELIRVMFEAFYKKRISPCFDLIKDSRPIPVTDQNKNQIFQRSSLQPPFDLAGYTVTSYAEQFPELTAREASMSMIFHDEGEVAVAVDNTYKYQEWDALFDEMMACDGIFHRTGLHKAFVMFTDVDDIEPIHKLFENTVAGFIVDRTEKTLTVFDAVSAVVIYHELICLASKQYGPFYGVSARSGIKHIHCDTQKCCFSKHEKYVEKFNQLLTEYKTDFRVTERIKSLTRGDDWSSFLRRI